MGNSLSSKRSLTCNRTDCFPRAYRFFSPAEFAPHRSLAKFHDWGIPVSWSEAWNSLHIWRFVRPVQDTSWLSFHGILPTADRLHCFGMRVNTNCFCGQPEDLINLFTTCHFARAVLDWFSHRICQFQPSITPLSPSVIVFGFPSGADIPIAYSALLGILCHQIWLVRNAYRFDNVTPDVPVSLKKVRSTFRFLIRMHKRHCPPHRFAHDWLADNHIGTVNDKNWIHFSRDFIT